MIPMKVPVFEENHFSLQHQDNFSSKKINKMGQWRNQRGNWKIDGDKWKWKHYVPKSLGHSKNSSKKKVYGYKGLLQEIRKISNK